MAKAIDIRKYNGIRLGLIGARKLRNYTQVELAKKANMSRSTLEQLELGKRGTKQETWLLLKDVLLVDSVEQLWRRYDYIEGKYVADDGTVIKDPAVQK